MLQQGGIAARGISTGGQITSIRMEHTWVSAYVNWIPSRGAKDGGASLTPRQHPNPNASLNAWVPLDGAYKPVTYSAGTNMAELAPLNGPALFGRVKQGATCTPAIANSLTISALANSYTDFNTQVGSQLGVLGSNASVTQILGIGSITPRQQALLAGTLPYATVVANTPTAALAATQSWTLQLNVLSGVNAIFAAQRPIADLQGQTLSLAFVPITSTDATTLAGLLRPATASNGTTIDPATGLPTRIPAYLAQLKAQVSLNGQVVAEGGSFTLGQSLVLRSVLTGPDGAQLSSDNSLVVGETHAWAIQGQALGANAPAAAAANLTNLRSQLQTAQANALPTGPLQTAQLLSSLATTYQATLDAKARLYQSVAGVVEVRLPSLVRASTRLEVETALGVVTYVRPAGIGLHVDHQGSASVSMTGTGTVPAYQQQSQERASASAHQLLDKLFGPNGNAPQTSPAQSALSGLATATLQNQTILRADSTTLPAVLTSLNAASNLRTPIQDAVASGQQALLAQNVVDMGGAATPLPMEPLVLNDPSNGAASYSVTSFNAPLVQLTAQRTGLVGWLGLADATASKTLLSPVIDANLAQLNTVQTLLGDWSGMRWQGFVGQTDVLDGLFLSRISDAAQINTGSTAACDWLISTLASQLSRGLPDTAKLNRPPVITSTPPTTATIGQAYTYAVIATDPDGDALTYSLSGAPTGMTISASGVIAWNRPTQGDFNLVVQVDDGRIAVQQPYVLSASGPSNGLQLNVLLDPSIANAGQTVNLTVQASAPAGSPTPTLSATLDGASLSLDASGIAHFTAPQAGTHRVLATAKSGVLTSNQELILTVRDTSGTPPNAVAIITSPQGDDSIKGNVTITGTATAATFAYYELKLRPVGAADTAWTMLKRSLTQAPSTTPAATLGQLDTTTLVNGLYQIALRVVDVNGVETITSVTVNVVGNLKLGQFHLSFTDVQAQATGLPLMLTRTYDTGKRTEPGDFGFGWTASDQDISVKKNKLFGLDWQVVAQQLNSCIIPVGKRRITITLPDGGLYRFDAANDPQCSFGQTPQVNIVFTPVPGPSGGIAGQTSGSAQLKINDGVLPMAQGGILVDTDTGLAWNPLDFVLTTDNGFQYALREGVGIQSVTDPYGDRVTFNANGFTHSSGLSVSLTRDNQGRIANATDPNGQSLTYSYSAQGDLQTVTDRAGGVTRFAYATDPTLPHLLVSITDPRGVVVMANQFDAQGRLTASADALGQATQRQFDTNSNTQTTFDRRGNKTVYTFDADGNITKVVNALGQTSTSTFDTNGNELTSTNALGQTTTRTFDENGNVTSEKNPLGQTTSTTYSGVGALWQRVNPLAVTDAMGNSTTIGYNGAEMQPGATPAAINEPLGRTTGIDVVQGKLRSLNVAGENYLYSYDQLGRRIQEANGLGNVIKYTYDANGNQTTKTVIKTVNGVQQSLTTTSVYDSQNRVISTTDPLGATRTMAYNTAGKLISSTDALGRTTTNTYDAAARLVGTQYPDGSSDSTSYDAEGNVTSTTDRAGRITRMDFDALNRQIKTTYPDGSVATTVYDAAGQVTATTDRFGHTSLMEFDSAGRQTAKVNATGGRTTFAYDANGNNTSVTVDGRTTAFTYDALNHVTNISYPDGSSRSAVYRADNRKQSETDQRGVTTSYGYDVAGRLTSVTQSQSANGTATTNYNYDETGAKTTQTDALGRTTTWELDAGRRITGRTIADGSVERSSYDLTGRRTARTTFAGEQLTFQYGNLGQLTGAIIPAGVGGNSSIAQTSVLFAYTPNGRISSRQEQGPTTLNGTQTYNYDANDLLTQTSSPLGQLNYSSSSDTNGTELDRSVSNPSSDAGTTISTFDAAGRLVSVKAPDGKQARYTYDSGGRLVQTDRDLNAQGGQVQVLRTYQRYDSANRVIAYAHVKLTGSTQTLIVGQALTRDAGGAVTRIDLYRTGFGAAPASFDAASGLFSGTVARSQSFEFDASARLTRENRIDAVTPTQSVDTHYAYDAVGNRISKTATSSAGTDSTTFTYDSADRLTKEQVSPAAGGTKTTTYQWDGNGNRAAKLEPGKATLLRFDPQNRLIDVRTGATQAAAQGATPTMSYAYDVNGNRIRKTTAQGTTNYLVDANMDYSQVVLESSGTTSTGYVWGNQLIRQTQGGSGNLFVGVNAGNDLFPLQGHLNSSLGAIDANGNVVEQSLGDAFGQLDTPTGLKQNHLFAGEYWDQDSQLVYLRARWYDPRIGQFVSADPLEGKQSDARSLNRYVYASNDPVQRTDPSGAMSLGELGAGMDIQGVLINLAKDQAWGYVQDRIFGGDDTEDGQPNLYDMLIGILMKSITGGIVSTEPGSEPEPTGGGGGGGGGGFKSNSAGATGGGGWGGKTEDHHVIPEYMCGAKTQIDLVTLNVADHRTIHSELIAYNYAVTLAGVVYNKLFRRRHSYEPKSPVNRLARTRIGRSEIALALEGFYLQGGWFDDGAGVKTGAPLGFVLGFEAPLYIYKKDHHQYDRVLPCKKR